MYGLHHSCPVSHTFLCKFWHFWMAVSCLLLDLFTPNFFFCKSRCAPSDYVDQLVANPIIYRLVLSPPTYEIRQWHAMAYAWNGCSQSSRFPTAGQGVYGSRGTKLWERDWNNSKYRRPCVVKCSEMQRRLKPEYHLFLLREHDL